MGLPGSCVKFYSSENMFEILFIWADVLENCAQITLRLLFRPEFRVIA